VAGGELYWDGGGTRKKRGLFRRQERPLHSVCAGFSCYRVYLYRAPNVGVMMTGTRDGEPARGRVGVLGKRGDEKRKKGQGAVWLVEAYQNKRGCLKKSTLGDVSKDGKGELPG